MLRRAVRRLLPAGSLLAAARPRRRTYSKVHGIFINYVDHRRPHLFARPTSSRTIVDAMLDFLPDNDRLRWWWSVLDHSDGLLLCDMGTGELCVCNPATRRWTLIPCPRREGARGEYLAFDPAVSPHYQVVVVPAAPPGFGKPPFVDDDASRRLLGSEWPPTPWRLNVFSSRTGRWEERDFFRQGEAAGTVRDLVLHQANTSWGCHRYAVYCRGALYVHCRGSFVLRLSLSKGTYQVTRTPAYNENKRYVKPYLGRSQNMIYFGIVEEPQCLRVWILSESSGQMEWILKYQDDLVPLAKHLTKYDRYDKPMDAPWMVHDVSDADEDVAAKAITKKRFEWDSDDDDFFTIKHSAMVCHGYFDILGFHPYKEVVYLTDVFGVVAYHLNNSKVQYLGNSRPKSYRLAHSNDIDESFVYTPCMVGELNEENNDRSSS